MSESVRMGFLSVRANAVPMVVLWTVAAALVGGYFFVPGVAAVYSFPQVLQIQVLGLIGSCWALVSLRLARDVSR